MQALRSGGLGNGVCLGKFREYFAHNLRVALEKKGLKQQKMAAKALAVSEPTLSSWLNAESAPRDDETWERLAKTLDLTYEDLLRIPSDDPEDPLIRVIRREADIRGFDLVPRVKVPPKSKKKH